MTWSLTCETAFQTLKQELLQAPILAYADFTQPFILYIDSSNLGLGAVLAQRQQGVERVIAYASRSLHPAERNDSNYSSFKLELLAMKWAMSEKFKDYLWGAKVLVVTDNNLWSTYAQLSWGRSNSGGWLSWLIMTISCSIGQDGNT